MDPVRFGIVGLGFIGKLHLDYFDNIRGGVVTAAADVNPEALKEFEEEHKGARGFQKVEDMMDSGLIDAALVCTPHDFHVDICCAAFEKGLHVLCEKPIAVHVKQANQVNEAHAKHPDLKFSVMLQNRILPGPWKAHEMIESGELGRMHRVTFIDTAWMRTEAYFASGGWRATWKGEGGGVLLNQAPHSLDLLTWLAGVPKQVTAMIALGARHNIEVEDEVAALLKYEDDVFGQFITSTGEAPGTNLLELAFDRGLLRVQHQKCQFIRNTMPSEQFIRESDLKYDPPESWDIDLPLMPAPPEPRHQVITQNFVQAIEGTEPLIAPGEEALNSLALGNSILLSGLRGESVDCPPDADEMEAEIERLRKASTFVKPS